MEIVRFKDLCIDATDPATAGAFWAPALGLELQTLDDGDVVLRGTTPEQTVWINRVPEPRKVKQRVHLDLHAHSVAEYEALGATVLPGWDTPWTVMGDPESGGELCVFERDDAWWAEHPSASRLYEVAVDAADHAAITAWWADVLGGEVEDDGRDFSWIQVAGAPFESLVFQTVPEPKTVKNRIHWDVTGPPGAADELVRRGARVLRAPDDVVAWTVMADPEGNEFCVFTEEP
ncbi:VOC family protein [Mumia sp. DW29H23]|uniref:VOC family protein n=1 Tax=Mumia sp. DW29H23 TaxID=3421241 RepID=UPI003D69E689